MKNQTIKAVIAALTLITGNAAFAGSSQPEVRRGCCISSTLKWGTCTGTKAGGSICPVSCTSHGEIGCPPRDQQITGNATNQESLADNMWPKEITAGRARGDVVKFDLANTPAIKLGASGSIKLPQVGSFSLYELPFTPVEAKAVAAYGNLPANERVIKIVIGAFNLENADLNAKTMLSPKMKQIIAAAKQAHPEAKSMIWVGRLLPKETGVTELATSSLKEADLSQTAPLSYSTNANGSAQVNLPDTKDAKGEKIKIDLAAVR